MHTPQQVVKPPAPLDQPGSILGSVYESAISVSGTTFRPSTAAFAGYGRMGKLRTGHRVIVTEVRAF